MRKFVDLFVFLGLAIGLFYYATVAQVDRIYWICVQYCMRSAELLHLSLYDFYVVLFVFVMPTMLLTLLVLACVKFIYGRLNRS